jgi:hypothetical protein
VPSRISSPENPKRRGRDQRNIPPPRQGGKPHIEKSSPAGRNLPGKFLPGEGGIVAIVAAIELDFIGIVITIISTSTIITTVSTLSSCNILGMILA